MNVSDVLHALIDQARWGPDQFDNQYGQLNAHSAVDAFASHLQVPDGELIEPPVPKASPVVPTQTIDYAKLAQEIVKAQNQTQPAEPVAPVEPAPAAVVEPVQPA